MRKERGLERSIDNLFIISIVLNILFFVAFLTIIPPIKTEPYYPSFYNVVIGYGSNPAALDPIDTWDAPSRVFQHQVTQSLVEYDLSTHPNYQLKPVLSEYWIWENITRISFKLRDNVYFHDNTRMTAEDVKWNFERLMWLCNATGTLPANDSSWEAFPSKLFFFENGTYIFKSFEANDTIDPLSFTINLNAPFSALLDLLTFGAINILSPASTPFYRYLDLAEEKLIGTGPYEYVHFKRDKEVRLSRNDLYWAFPGYFETAVFRIIEDDTARMTAGLAGQFDYVSGVPESYIDTFNGDPNFHVEDVGEDLCYFYLEIYCGARDTTGDLIVPGDYQYQRNNATLRRAITLAINYTYIYDVIQNGLATEGTTAVPRAMPGHNASVVQASYYNFTTGIKMARDLMKIYNPICATWDSSYPGTDEGLWTNANLLGRSFYLYRHFGSIINQNLNLLIDSNLNLIGIQASEIPIDWDPIYFLEEKKPWEMDLRYIGWCPDYLNPYNIIDPLFNLESYSCFSRINDTSIGGLSYMMKAAIKETNRTKQLEIYGNIQSYIFDVDRPLTPASHVHIPLWVYHLEQIHKKSLKGVHYNVMKLLEVKNWYEDD
ncbi:MAG: ABC transporter substrate-binding protein [Promethearchaeota archaeon]